MTTAFASYSRRKAAFALGCVSIGIVVCLLASVKGPPAPSPSASSDVDVLWRIVDRVHAGENYYVAAGTELRASGYGTQSVFNWRTPVYAQFMGAFPSHQWTGSIAFVLALITMAASFRAMAKDGGVWLAAIHSFPLFGALAGCFFTNLSVLTENWAAMLICLSLVVYSAPGLRSFSVVFGILALFIRELTLPYVLLCLGLAIWKNRSGEVRGWIVGLAAYFIYYGIHCLRVIHSLGDADKSYPTGWVRFGGIPFVLSTARMNVLLAPFPSWIVAIYLPLAVLGLCGWRSETGRRIMLVAILYIATYSVIGKPFNRYWGLLYAPLLTFGICWMPFAVKDIVKSLLLTSNQNRGLAS